MWGFFLGKTSRKRLGVQNVAELVEILRIYELYRSPTMFLSSSNISWMNSLPFACWQEVWTCRFFELKQRSYEAHSVEKSAKKCKKKNSWNQISEGIKSSTTTTQTYFSNFTFFPLLPHCARCSNANCISGGATLWQNFQIKKIFFCLICTIIMLQKWNL